MRRRDKDYHEIVTEAGRRKYPQVPRRQKLKVDRDGEYDTVERESIRPYRYARCEKRDLLDKLGVVKGFLESNVGKSWDKAWSKLKEACSGSLGGIHIGDHVHDWVELNPVFIGKIPHYPHRNGFVGLRYIDERGKTLIKGEGTWVRIYHGDYYVDRQGILRQHKWKKHELKKLTNKDPYTEVLNQKTGERRYTCEDGKQFTTTKAPEDLLMDPLRPVKYLCRPDDKRYWVRKEWLPWKMVKIRPSEKDKNFEYVMGPFVAYYPQEKTV